jgi:hypothetical protein
MTALFGLRIFGGLSMSYYSAWPRSVELERRIAAYAAAGLAGASLLAAVPDAEAKVVYTPAHVVIDRGATFDLDVNGDGAVDFVFSKRGKHVHPALRGNPARSC